MAEKKKPAAKKEQPVTEVAISRRDDGWWWSARAGNGKEVASSGEGYKNRAYAYKMARLLYPGVPTVAG